MEILKVSSKSSPNSVAGAIAGVVRDYGCVEVQAVGAGATVYYYSGGYCSKGYLVELCILRQ